MVDLDPPASEERGKSRNAGLSGAFCPWPNVFAADGGMCMQLFRAARVLVALAVFIGVSRAHAQTSVPPAAPGDSTAPNNLRDVKTPSAPDQHRESDRFVLSKGDCSVVRRDVTIHDGSRAKDIELRVRIPRPAGGKSAPREGWPLVVFSHGAGGSRDAFPDLLEFWGSHGYATIAITHEDSLLLQRRNGQGRSLRELATEKGRRELRNSVDLGGRVADCSFVLDHLDEIGAAVAKSGGDPLTIDRSRLAMAGHSAGAFTTQLVVGVKVRAMAVRQRGLGFTSVGDDRFKAAIIISGQGTTSKILGPDAWSEVKVPMFVVGGSLDSSPPGMGPETPESRRHPFEYSRGTSKGGPPAYLLFIEGATHSSYSGGGGGVLRDKATTDVGEIGEAVCSGTTLFLNAHVKNDAEAEGQLHSDRLKDSIPGKVTFERK
jgi:dienelactone hydrolase